MTTASIELVAQAEKILGRTLAYQAAIAVHELKDRLDLDVAELRLVVMPELVAEPGPTGWFAMPKPVTLEVMAEPARSITPIGKRAKDAGPSQPAKPKQGARRRRSQG